jgi:hypothetical protein
VPQLRQECHQGDPQAKVDIDVKLKRMAGASGSINPPSLLCSRKSGFRLAIRE